MTILRRSLPEGNLSHRLEPLGGAVIDLSHLVQPETRLLIMTPARGAQPPPAA